MNFKKWVKSIQTAGYNGARTVVDIPFFNWVIKLKYLRNKHKNYHCAPRILCASFFVHLTRSTLMWRSPLIKQFLLNFSLANELHCSRIGGKNYFCIIQEIVKMYFCRETVSFPWILITLESGISVPPWINVAPGKFSKKNKRSPIFTLYSYYLNRLYEVRNKAVAPGKKSKN